MFYQEFNFLIVTNLALIHFKDLSLEYNFVYFFIFWFLLLIIITIIIYKYLSNKFKNINNEILNKEIYLKEETEKLKQKILLENQKQLNIEKEQLAHQIKEKTIELAIIAKDDDDKIRLLHTIREKISEAEDNPNIYKIRLKEMRRLLDHYLEIDNRTFEIQMDELHQEFFKAMMIKFPNLSIYDLRLSAYLKIGLNSKEMADILNVLPSSINVSRSRLRKKLGLKPEDDLFQFLNNIK